MDIKKIEGINIPVGTYVDSETYDYLKRESKKHGISITHFIMFILENEKEKAKRRPKITVEKE